LTLHSAPTPVDSVAREAALDPRRSFIVQAPAGSGKTDLLVKRYIRLLGLVKEPEEILAITFTKKAAAEMRRRVLTDLGDASLAPRLRIQTIDALCASLTRQMPVLARFGAQPEIVEDASELYAEAATQTLQELSPPAMRLLAHLDNNVGFAVALLADMLRNRDRWLRKTGLAPTRAELEIALISERHRLLQRAQALYPGASAEFAREVLTEKGTWRKKPKPAPPELAGIPGLQEALFALCSMPPARYSDTQWEALEAILALLNPAVARLKVIFGSRGQADFTEFAHGALLALGSADDPSDLLLSVDARISHILVDEFQDTSQSQFSLLEKLTSGWQSGDGRTLFLVGDPMQSIYRFREAEVSLFLTSREMGLGSVTLEPLTLQTNFRSQANLVEWFNAAFSRVLPPEEDAASGAVPYARAVAAEKNPPLPGKAVTWHGFYDRVSEAETVIALLKGASGTKAILVRNRTHLDHIVPALKEAGIRFRAVEIEQLGEKQAVQDLFALTRALTHLGDRIAWLSILRAPWCGLALSDLALLAEPHPHALIPDLLRDDSHLSADGQARIARLKAVLDPVLRNRLRGTLRDAVEGAWLALGGPACVDSETELEDAEIFLDELERLEEAGAVDLAKLHEKMDALYALPDVTAPADAVEIMTIHKSKGLEFDTVIVPGLDRSPRSGSKPLFAWKSLVSGSVWPPDKGAVSRGDAAASGGLLLAPIDETGAESDPTYKYVRALDREAEDIEAGRLFYVAATRAKQRLHLLACATCEKEENETGARPLRQPNKRSLLSKIWWQAQEHFGPAPELITDEPRRAIPDLLRRLPADFITPNPPPPTAWKSPDESREEEQIEFSWVGETARHVGTVVHRWLQRIADEELRGWDPARVERLKPQFRRDLQRRGVPALEAERSAEVVALALTNSLTDDRGRWILGAHPDARTELRLRGRSPTGTRAFVMDRVFRDQGRLWIVDYKTSRHEGTDLEGFLDRERDRYAVQLQAYGSLMRGSATGLYFPLLRGWRQGPPFQQ
jgi:ATP-dependent helicase/nuclease subunit A